ncbi:WXG100 family type VII secretion target [Mycobacterium sp. 012931]|uniref:WXG100 family type VII secretion target n=1 Tax=Mycobacterium sp. 012931 TaxID=1187065 RepID=UPI0004219BCB|nr:WXG100 family type VII secretion target [Mycobacterium sp. 012931]
MTTRFMTDPHAMRDMAGRFEMHAQTVEDEARRMWASSQNIAGAGWSGMASATSLDTMGQMNTAFRNIVNMLHGVRDGVRGRYAAALIGPRDGLPASRG